MKEDELDIEKHQEILVKMIDERIYILDVMNMHLEERMKHIDLEKIK